MFNFLMLNTLQYILFLTVHFVSVVLVLCLSQEVTSFINPYFRCKIQVLLYIKQIARIFPNENDLGHK